MTCQDGDRRKWSCCAAQCWRQHWQGCDPDDGLRLLAAVNKTTSTVESCHGLPSGKFVETGGLSRRLETPLLGNRIVSHEGCNLLQELLESDEKSKVRSIFFAIIAKSWSPDA